jgi:poly-gamma-glutamate capsule biosynthesis protein CapA/YwtB (metallophosphatase superfamily)
MKSYLLSGLIFCWLSCGNASQKSNIETKLVTSGTLPGNTSLSKSTADTISLIAVGDMMFGTNFPSASTLAPNDGKDLLKDFESVLQNADITFGNSEGVFLDAGGTPKGIGGNVFSFREPRRYAQYFVDNGFDLLSVANNHVADFGEVGMQSTVATLKALGLHFAGLQNYPTTIITVRNIKIGLAAFAPHKGCIQMNDYAAAAASVQNLKKQCDIVMVSFHGGAEGQHATHVPKRTELFFDQNRGNVYEFAHKMIDAGADIVIGHGPHVARAMEVYNNKFIAYSLGNFCTYGMFNLKGVSGIAPLLKIYVNEKGDFIRGTITSIKQEGEGGPLRDGNYGAYRSIKELTAADIPNSHLKFTDSVNIEKE